ncbi:MAG: hypothetical protein ACKV22_28870 [Bryobacteraceae bacterium]
MTSPIFTGSSTLSYDFTVGWGYSSAVDAKYVSPREGFRAAFAKVHPGKNMDETMKAFGGDRRIVRAELWRVIDTASK